MQGQGLQLATHDGEVLISCPTVGSLILTTDGTLELVNLLVRSLFLAQAGASVSIGEIASDQCVFIPADSERTARHA